MKLLKLIYRFYILLKQQYGFNIFIIVYRMTGFAFDYIKYALLDRNLQFSLSMMDWYPCLTDKTETTPLDPVYFYQDAWAAGKIFQNKPKHHYDVGSAAKTIGIISQFVPTTMVDIRPIELKMDNLFFTKGSILELPFADNSIESISSLCVVEHIGLGRYGDPLDQFGSEKAIKELIRVTKPNGNIYFSVPIDEENKVFFNGHRAFTTEYIKKLFLKCKVEEELYIVDNKLRPDYIKSKGYAVALFSIKKDGL
jgi:SAM-dependent methyltransferase